MADKKSNLSIPNGVPISDKDGRLTNPWLIWFNNLYKRVGATNALTNIELENQTLKNTEDIIIINDNVAQNTEDILENKADIESLETQVTTNTNNIATNTTNITSLQTQVTTNTNNIATNTTNITSLQTQVTTNTSDITTLKANVIQTLTNIGTGIGLFKNKVANNANLKSIKAGTNITIDNTTDPDTLVINASGGGSGLTNFDDVLNIAGVNATTPVAALVSKSATYTNLDVALVAKGNGSILAQIPNGLASGGNKRAASTFDVQTLRSSASEVASGFLSAIVGAYYSLCNGTASVIVGGFSNYITSGSNSVIVGGDSNTIESTGVINASSNCKIKSTANVNVINASANSTIQTNSTYCVINGGTANIIQGFSSNFVINGGLNNLIDGCISSSCAGQNHYMLNSSYAAILGGDRCTASFAQYGYTVGYYCTVNSRYGFSEGAFAHTRGIIGAKVRSNLSFTNISDGKTQHGEYDIAGQTSSSSSVDLTTNANGTASTNNQMIISTNEIRTIKGIITIRDKTTASVAAIYNVEITARNISGTVSILSNNITSIFADAAALTAGFTLVVTVDTTNVGIKFTASKTSGNDIVVFGSLKTTEFIY